MKILKLNRLVLLLGLIQFSTSNAQNKQLTLEEVIRLAQENSPGFARAENRFENDYWQYRNFKAGLRPQLALNGTLPGFTRSIERITLPDGSDAFVNRSLGSADVNLTMFQNVGFTGGTLFVNSRLQRIDLFDQRTTSYLSNPISIGYRQNALFFNPFKYDRKIAPLRYDEARKNYAEQMERIAIEVSTLYFQLLLAETNFQIASINLSNTDTLFKISQGRYNLGKIAENDLLQLELSLLNAENNLNQAELDQKLATQNLKRYLQIPDSEVLTLDIPVDVPVLAIEPTRAIEEARDNRQSVLAFRRQRLEAERELARAKGENGLVLGVNFDIGYTQRAGNIEGAYVNPQNLTSGALTFSIPIVDWGVAKSRRKIAESNQKLIEVNVQQDEVNFEQEVYLQVMRFNMASAQLNVAAKADTIAQKRFEVTKQRYLIGKISITDLNLAIAEKDQAKQGYINSLQNWWTSYYLVRALTLFDFERNTKLAIPE